MIIVNNTKELEQQYDLSRIPDNEMIRVLGGTIGKDKYNESRYIRRTTYSARDLKQIINIMKNIEYSIPNEWGISERAQYIYEVLADNITYNRNQEEYSNQQSSNLTILLSRKGICAGYSLLFKEMMDRQGIPCDYVRGNAFDSRGNSLGIHAWNVLQIGDRVFQVDLTWDAENRHNGKRNLEFYGNNMEFNKQHIPEDDERRYNFADLNPRNMSSAYKNTDEEFYRKQKLSVIQNAIGETYKKYRAIQGADQARDMVQKVVMTYIKEGREDVFTRSNNAREGIQRYINPRDMLDIVIREYLENAKFAQGRVQLGDLLQQVAEENVRMYGIETTQEQLRDYIMCGDSHLFTSQRFYQLGGEGVLQNIIKNIVDKTIPKEEKLWFQATELASIPRPEQEVLESAKKWIKEKYRAKQFEENKQIVYDRKQLENEEQRE